MHAPTSPSAPCVSVMARYKGRASACTDDGGLSQAYIGDELGYSTMPQTKDMTIAVLDVGSIDGANEVDEAVVRGIVVPVVGDGGMNMHMLDVTDVPGVQVIPSFLFLLDRFSFVVPPALFRLPNSTKHVHLANPHVHCP